MANGAQFKASIKDWATKFPQKMDALARQTAYSVSELVVMGTPVDTGFLRSSWQPSIGAPKPGQGQAVGEASLGAAMSQIGLTIPQLKAGEHFYMTNNAKYAEFVEFGTTKMAGRFYVTDNVKRWPQIVAKVARSLEMK